MGVLVEGSNISSVASKSQLDSWVSSLKTPNTWTLDSAKPEHMKDFFGVERDTFITIDLKTMKVVDVQSNDAQGALDNLTALLAK